MKYSILYKLVLFSGLLFTSLHGFTQEEIVKTDSTTKAEEIKIIPIADIPNEVPKASSEIREIRRDMVPDSVLVFQKERLDTFLLSFKSFSNNLEKGDTGVSPQVKLESQLYLWNKQKSTLNDLQSDFESIRDKLNTQKEAIDKTLLVWETSKEAIEKVDETPENVFQLINEFVSFTNLVKDTLNQKNTIVYEQLNRITETTINIDDNISNIESNLQGNIAKLLTTKEPSLFHQIIEGKKEIKPFGEISSNIKKSVLPFSDFIYSKMYVLIFHFIFLLFLIALFVYIKKSLNYNKFRELDKKLIHAALTLLNNPISTSLLIALLFSLILYPNAPLIVRQLVFLFLVIPLMILIPKLIEKSLRTYIYGLGFVFVLFNYLDFAFYKSIGENLIEILIALVVFYGLFKILRNEDFNKLFLRKSSRVIFNSLFSIFLVFLLVGIIANTIGYFVLGSYLIFRVVVSLYAFILFFTSFQVVAGFVKLSLNLEWMQEFKVIKSNKDRISAWLNSTIYLFALLFFFYTIFYIFEVKEYVIDAIKSIWEFGFNAGEINITLGNVVIFFFTLWLAMLISNITSAILEQDILYRMKLKRGVPRTISTLVKYAVITIGFLIAIAAAGMELQNLTIIIGALGVGIGFGLQDVINNFISGLILLFERPIQVGDTVQVGELWGDVKRIGIRASVIRTFSGSEVIVPNGMLISREVTNWTLSDSKRRLDLEVGVAYGTELNKVIEILKKCASDHKEVMEDPGPSAWFTGFGDSSINFKLVFWFPSFDGGLAVKTEVGLAVDKALKEANITIPFPQRDLYIKEVRDTPNQEGQTLKKTPTKKTPPQK
ncbi:MAG: mechanosensitive ion channel [Bacteroidales bacterium]|nr:mechanosensitive ion channel [Bacteroidales bacterium]